METEVLHFANEYIQLAMSNALNSLTSSILPRCRSSSCQREQTFDVQYSFSLCQPLLTKINQQQCYVSSTRNFVDEFVEHSLRSALLQVRLILSRFQHYIYE